MRKKKHQSPRLTGNSAEFLSDTHLLNPFNGAAHYHGAMIMNGTAPRLYLAGDLIDWISVEMKLRSLKYMPEDMPRDIEKLISVLDAEDDYESHLRVLDAVMMRVDHGHSVVYTPGNHDPDYDLYAGRMVEGIQVAKSAIYKDAKGLTHLVEHGHRFDPAALQNYEGWYAIGGKILEWGLQLDYAIARKFPEFKDAFYATNGLKKAGKVLYIPTFMANAFKRAQGAGANGIICGHIHDLKQTTQQVKMDQRSYSYMYKNTGDALTHGTALVETVDGDFIANYGKNMDLEGHDLFRRENILERYRPSTMNFLQAGWSARLDTLREQVILKMLPPATVTEPAEPEAVFA